MEYQGIVTGIGQKSNNLPFIEVVSLPTENIQLNTIYYILGNTTCTFYVAKLVGGEYEWVQIGEKLSIGDANLIQPKLDADVYDYIVGKNAIIDGLEIAGNTLTAGICMLCGYRGKLNSTISSIGTNRYIYGKFTLNFSEVEDSFVIETTNTAYTTPSEITSAGTYYLRLYTYTNGAYVANPDLDTSHQYPAKAFEAAQTDLLMANGVIGENATATTQEADDNSDKVATTKYVNNQIEKEIAFAQTNGNLTGASGATISYSAKRKSKYVILEVSFSFSGGGIIVSSSAGSITISGIANGFCPKTVVTAGVQQGQSSTSYVHANLITGATINTDGTITISYAAASSSSSAYTYVIIPTLINAGYETN